MARIRTIKPEFWTDGTLGECSPIARLLFVASLNFADDNGNLERSSRQLKAQAFPYDDIDCEPLVAELLRHGLLIEYQVSDRKYLHIKGFLNHQRIDRPSKCRIPVYESSMSVRPTLVEPSTSPRAVREGKGRDMEGRGKDQEGMQGETRATRSTASRLPDDWNLTPERKQIAEAEGADATRTFANFTDYWKSAGGQKARKHDWDAAWRIWCRREGDSKKVASLPRKTRYEEITGPLEAAINGHR
jgi:hypothetical protein